MSSTRILSYSEVQTALDCQAKWDFRYGGHLAGDALREKAIAPILSGGRAFGAAVATWHVNMGHIDAGEEALRAMDESLDADADQQREHGVHQQDKHDELRLDLLRIVQHYMELADEVVMDPVLERALLVPIPSRTGVRSSTRYKLLSYLDATETDEDGGLWINEFKLRGSLTSVALLQLNRQIRWYSWAYWKATGKKPIGVYVNERLREFPKPPRLVKTGRKDGSVRPSHATDQLCTAAAYVQVCREYEEEPHQETLDALQARRWQQRVPILFRDTELQEAGRELVSAARLIHDLDTGELMPLRNAKRANCNGCAFRDICASPDNALVDALFERRPPKRDRDPDEVLHTRG